VSMFRDLISLPFDQLPAENIVRAFDVEYAYLSPPEGGDLYVTRFGWPYAVQLFPENWYIDKYFLNHGEKLPGATGSVYHVLSKPVNGKQADLVVKFSRIAQETSILIETSFPDDVSPEVIAAARFNSPMEEFGLVMELRRSIFGSRDFRILTQRPFAIYTPPEQVQEWQLGRDTSRFKMHNQILAKDQEEAIKAIELDIKRIYVLLYGWIKGVDAEQAFLEGDLSRQELRDLTKRVIDELKEKGFRVLDNKPRHFILRKDQRDGRLIHRDERKLTYALVDFELLQRTPEHKRMFKIIQWERYRKLRSSSHETNVISTPSYLKNIKIFDIDYVFGLTPDGGKLWVLGKNPDLFDYFLPDRWRRTPRIKLSPDNEIYQTRTRDNIDLVYRRSRVGSRPRVDPLTKEGIRIREHGYNSPFEEVLIAERLRQLDIDTIYPRAVYQTGHKATKVAFLSDSKRFENHSHLMIPGDTPNPILVPKYDYYTIWDLFKGFSPVSDWDDDRTIDLEYAKESGLFDAESYTKITTRIEHTFLEAGLAVEFAKEYQFFVFLDNDNSIYKNERGEIEAASGIDALTAYELGFLNKEMYRSAIMRLNEKLLAADCEKLDLKGTHLLLSIRPDGDFMRDREGALRMALCNFEFIRGLYRPIR